MSGNRRYIELYSGSRNRTRYPLPSSYVVPFASTRQILHPSQAMDAQCSGPIYYTWQGGNPLGGAPLSSMAGSNISQVVLPVPYNPPRTTRNDYFVGYNLTNTTSAPSQTRKILRYAPSSNSFMPDEAFTTYTAGDQFLITDPSDGLTKIHFPAVDINGLVIPFFDNAYDGYYLIDETLSTTLGYIVSSRISYFDVSCQIATLETPFPLGWQLTDTYTLRRSLPQEKFILDTPNIPNTFDFFQFNGLSIPGMVIALPVGQGTTEQNAYANKYVYHSFNEQLPPNLSPNPLVKENVHGGGTYGLYFITMSYFDVALNRVLLLINVDDNDEYNGTQIPNYSPITGGAAINIVSFLKDNFSPLNYNGTMTSVNQAVSYEIGLVSLIIPNTMLVTGSRLVFYPFVYVELSNVSSPSGASHDIIYSNNPPSNRALFVVPVTDTTQPLFSSFMKLSSGMAQIVKFKPNDSLKFSVYLPDGKLFETVATDYLSPYPPNVRLQIEAVFSVRRLVA
jgi:hypothetical protein